VRPVHPREWVMELTDLDLDGTRCLAEIGIAGLVFCMGICMGIVWSLGFLVVLTVQSQFMYSS
jgi:hypothetical protein